MPRLLCLVGLIAHHGNEQVGDAERAHLAKRGELVTIDMIEQQDAQPKTGARGSA